jgi:hypothetical protein
MRLKAIFVGLKNEETMAVEQVELLVPYCIKMLDSTITVLKKGWSAMSPAEQEAFLLIYDPANTGQVDESYVRQVLKNYQKIRSDFDKAIKVEYEFENDRCIGQRLC